MTTPVTRWTLVQHSGMGYGGDVAFAKAVEVRAVDTIPAQRTVQREGGLLFVSWDEAERAEEQVNYPPGLQGLIPRARGAFSAVKVDGLRIYRPAHDESFTGLVGLGMTV